MTDVTSAGAGRSWALRHRVSLGIAGAAVAAGMTVLWCVVVPDKADTTTGLHSAAIRYSHPATWALLSLLGVLIAADAPKRIRGIVAGMSLAAYAAFLIGMVL